MTSKRVRRSVGTRDWRRAGRLVDRWESDAKAGDIEALRLPPIETLTADFIADCRVRKLAASSVDSYQRALDHFAKLCPGPVNEIAVDQIAAWRNARAAMPGRKDEFISGNTIGKEIEYVRVFCEYLVSRGFLATNPARKVKAPRGDSLPTLPFTEDEVKRLLDACEKIDNRFRQVVERSRLRARALLLLLLYSGLRISDAVKLKRERLDSDGRLLLRMMKTLNPVYVRIPKVAMKSLHALPVESEYFFWSGKSLLSTAIGSAQRTVECLARMTGIDAHAHRFRDTFSVELLKSGADLRTVQLLLGHKSIKTTEKHYAPWVLDFQRQLDRATAKLKFG